MGMGWARGRKHGKAVGRKLELLAATAQVLAKAAGAKRPSLAERLEGRVLLSGALIDIDFPGNITYPTGDAPWSVLAADVDRDGCVDLVTANAVGNVSILRNREDGTFHPHVEYAVGGYCRSVAAGDLNSDGYVDVVTGTISLGAVSVLLNRGDGTFGDYVAYKVGAAPVSVAITDLDGDGDADLVTADHGAGTVTVLLNHGDGVFDAGMAYSVGKYPMSVAAADVDGDGRADLAVAHLSTNNGISVLRNKGDGTFDAKVEYFVGAQQLSVTAADFERDGHVDLAVATGSGLMTLHNRGDGTFDAPVNCTSGRSCVSVAAADFDADGHPDLVAASSTTGAMVLRRRGDGTFEPPITYASRQFASVAVGDVDGDNYIDVVAATTQSDDVSVLRNRGTPLFQSQTIYATGHNPSSAAVADIDGDGKLDLITANSSLVLFAMKNQGEGRFPARAEYVLSHTALTVAAADIDGDGDADVMVGQLCSSVPVYRGSIAVLRNRGDGTFEDEVIYELDTMPWHIVAADLDGDGYSDLAAASTSGYPDFAGGISLLRGRGDGTFEAEVFYAMDEGPAAIAAADIDGDGRTDLVTASRKSDTVSVHHNLPGGTFVPSGKYAVGRAPRWIAAADVDGDGRADVVTADWDANTVTVLRNAGDGGLGTSVGYAAGARPSHVALADVSGDGYIDIVTANAGSYPQWGSTVSVLRNQKDGTFEAQAIYAVGREPRSVVAADLNGDGCLDLATANFGSQDVSVLLNIGRTQVVQDSWQGTADGDGFYLVQDAAQEKLVVYAGYLPEGEPSPGIPLGHDERLSFDLGGGADELIVNFGQGDPLPVGGLLVRGGEGSDTLKLVNVPAGMQVTLGPDHVAAGAGSIQLDGVEVLSMQGGMLAGALPAGGSKVVRVSEVQIGALDLNDNALIVDCADANSAEAMRKALGTAIADGSLSASGMNKPERKLVVAIAGDMGLTEFAGQQVSASSILVQYTWAADANLDGQVTTADFAELGKGYVVYQLNQGNPQAGFATKFTSGDFDGDGKVGTSDFAILSKAYVQSQLEKQQGQTGQAARGKVFQAKKRIRLRATHRRPVRR